MGYQSPIRKFIGIHSQITAKFYSIFVDGCFENCTKYLLFIILCVKIKMIIFKITQCIIKM